MSFKAIVYAYVLGGITFIPLVIVAVIFYTLYTAVPVGDLDPSKEARGKLERESQDKEKADEDPDTSSLTASAATEVNDTPKPRKGWLTVRRTFEEVAADASYVGLVRGFLDARSKDPKRSRPKDMWYVVLKGKVLYLYEDESMTDCEAAIEMSGHDVVIYPEGLQDAELFAKRNSICLKPKVPPPEKEMPSVTKEMQFGEDVERKIEMVEEKSTSPKQKQKEKERVTELDKKRGDAREEALDVATPWFIFVRSNVEMEDWYLSLIHASDNPPNSSTLAPLDAVFRPTDMYHLVATLDEQPDVIPMRWLNALIGRIFLSYYRTQALEDYIIGRLMRKLAKVKRPAFLTEVLVREVSVGDKAPTLSKPMLKELTKEGDAALEVQLHYKGEIRITIEAIATINLGARFKTYNVKLVLAAVLRELEGNLLIKVKRPPSSRIWYAFTTMPRMVLDVEPVVSDRQITWSMILSTIESRLKEVIQESVVLPNMDDISFFDSSKFPHRGGIWGEASRHEKSSTLFPESTPAPLSHGRSASTSSEPTADSSSTPPAPPVQRSQTEEPQSNTDLMKSPEEDFKPQATGIASTPSTSSSTKRRSWFVSAPKTESIDPFVEEGFADLYERGRPNGAQARRLSSQSTPDEPLPEVDEPVGDGTHLTPIPIARPASSRRSPSTSSQDASEGSSSLDNASSKSAPSDSGMAIFRNRSPSLSAKNSPISPTFFQTLKSRDKEAISNTAKETIRKWGANWASLRKKDGNGNNVQMGNGEIDAPAPSTSPAITPSAPSMYGSETLQPMPPMPQSTPESKMHKPRPSYAEVRAAVEQRRERERNQHGETMGNDDLLHSNPNPFADPASSFDPRGRSVSGVSTVSNPGIDRAISPAYLAGATLSPSTSPLPSRRESKDVDRSAPSSRSPSPRPRTISSTSKPTTKSDPILTTISPPLVPEEDDRPAIPIRTQPPQPKMMTIPGIHASHRGEVMSMGYAPPPPVPAPAMEQKKAPAAMQSVYRLWKNGPTTGTSGTGTPTTTTTAGGQADHQDSTFGIGEGGLNSNGVDGSGGTPPNGLASVSNDSQPSSSTTPIPPPLPATVVAAPPRPIPPPLPPRTNSMHVIPQVIKAEPTLSNSNTNSTPSLESQAVPGMERVASPASAALQSIVSKDRSKRASLEPVPPPPTVMSDDISDVTGSSTEGRPFTPSTPGKKPPLPPRRVPTSSPLIQS